MVLLFTNFPKVQLCLKQKLVPSRRNTARAFPVLSNDSILTVFKIRSNQQALWGNLQHRKVYSQYHGNVPSAGRDVGG